MRRAVGVLVVAGLLAPSVGLCAADLAARQTEAAREQQTLRARIDDLQTALEQRESARKEAADALRQSETEISRINRRLAELAEQQRVAERELTELKRQIVVQQGVLAKRQTELSGQLRAQYSSGLSPWTALLSGDDPQQLGRNLGYLDYVAQARARALTQLQQDIERLASLRKQADGRAAELESVAVETRTEKTALVTQQKERATVVAKLEGQISAQRAEAARLGRDDQRLGRLIDDLDAALVKQAEDARRAEEARRVAAEEARRQAQIQAEKAREAEAVRRAAQEKKLADARREAEATARQAEAARAADAARKSAETTKRAEAAQAAARDAAQVREQVESAMQRDREQAAQAAEQAAHAAQAERSGVRVGARPIPQSEARATLDVAALRRQGDAAEGGGTPPARVAREADDADRAPAASGSGLRRGLQPPVRGEVQGRFGVGRPDGGTWRGIVLRAAEGTPVHAVAPGTVVYAQWLRGFGNLVIVDHGNKYLTVYAYNQSVLKAVGDSVRAGETIALVGATGGQVESGLYFEIRHQGAPVDPAQWLAL
ncbi:peptidoglycan DD-metalloendopeptidase family protein [Alcaligenaceae bacterium C4P045]|nr:peptidoglycan DD-metalloendopeptidase family protein [Alcaligenaceae bacterium C4P045]